MNRVALGTRSRGLKRFLTGPQPSPLCSLKMIIFLFNVHVYIIYL